MFSRTVTFLLIAALVACPVGCVNGSCRACCEAPSVCGNSGETVAAGAANVEHCPSCSCCDRGERCEAPLEAVAAEATADGCAAGPCRPAPCPDSRRKSSCQGVCGGAVFERPSQVDDRIAADSVSHRASAAGVGSKAPTGHGFSQAPERRFSGANVGRSVRTRQRSFLC